MKWEPDIRAAGRAVALVGLGTPPFARAFREATGYARPIFVDSESLAYRAVALARMRPWSLLRPRMLRHALRARRGGFRQGATSGDPWQLGGTLVVSPGDRLLYSWRNTNADDDAPLDEVIAALRKGLA
jgi:hypothetical protein